MAHQLQGAFCWLDHLRVLSYVLCQGNVFSGFGENKDDKLRVYLLGNPVNYAISLLAVLLYPCVLSAFFVAKSRAESVGQQASTNFASVEVGLFPYVLWAMHFIPFIFMKRVLYFHHYAPAFIFSTIFTAAITVQAVRWSGFNSLSVDRFRLMFWHASSSRASGNSIAA
jgi:dolichyl-phosphate-mannose--protein O-mannosyl transferase